MTPPTSSSNTIVLNSSEDWEQWLAEVQAVADEAIWPHIDPDEPAPDSVQRLALVTVWFG
jgi:hypothetical protein